ncbi:MAG TPA: hypothetical protein VGB07_27475, partial [Blastocatellia bacterium]
RSLLVFESEYSEQRPSQFAETPVALQLGEFPVLSVGYRNRQTSKQNFSKTFRKARGGGIIAPCRRFAVSKRQTEEAFEDDFQNMKLSL